MMYETNRASPSFRFNGRHGAGRAHGPPHGGGRRGGPFRNGDAPSFGRKLGSDDLQLVLLALLAERPAHGYELIRTLEERSGGFYAPSSGMVYPALTYLDEIGHTDSVAEGNRKQHTITEAGRAYLARHQEAAQSILAALARIGGRMSEVREAFSGVSDGDPAAADEVYQARYALKQALRQKQGCGAAEARRIAAVLRQAAASIGTGTGEDA